MLKLLNQNRKIIISYGGLIVAYVVLVLFMRGNVNKFLDSDASSELILSQILSNDGGILSDKWYYSTELRVANTQIVYSLLFRIFNNWHQVRVLGNAILYLCMLISACYFCKGAKLMQYFPYVGTALLLPLSDIYFNNVLVGGYYVTHISLTFLVIGSILFYVNNRAVLVKMIIIFMTVGFSFIAGLGGIRLPFVLYTPLTIMALGMLYQNYLRKHRGQTVDQVSSKGKFAFIVGIADFAAFVGYLINSCLLSKQYTYMDFSDMNWNSISLEDLCGSINGFLESWGYRTGVSFFSLFSLTNVIFFIIFAGFAWLFFKRRAMVYQMCFEAKVIVFYFVAAVTVYSLFRMVSGYGIDRHNLSIAAFLVPVGCCLIDFERYGHDTGIYKKVLSGSLALVVINAIICYAAYWSSAGNQEKLQVANYLENHSECTQGWASFWNGNVFTELTNGKCEIWVWDDAESKDEPVLFQWLQKKEHDEKKPNGKCFYLFSMDEYQSLSWAQQFNIEDAVYCSDQYVIFEDCPDK